MITHNKYLKVLDLSWNKLGNIPKITSKLANVLADHRYLLHLDLSYCNYTYH